MSGMQIVQQRKPLSLLIPKKALKIAAVIGIAAVIAAISLLVSPLFGFIAASAISLGAALYTNDRWITRGLATTLSLSIINISLAILFPPALLVTLPLMALLSGTIFSYASAALIDK